MPSILAGATVILLYLSLAFAGRNKKLSRAAVSPKNQHPSPPPHPHLKVTLYDTRKICSRCRCSPLRLSPIYGRRNTPVLYSHTPNSTSFDACLLFSQEPHKVAQRRESSPRSLSSQLRELIVRHGFTNPAKISSFSSFL